MKYLKKILTIPLVAFALGNPCFAKENTPRKLLETTLNYELPETPRINLPPERCAEYARRSASTLYNKNYIPSGQAWNLRYYNQIVFPVENSGDILIFADKKILKPGMMIGVENPRSNHKISKRKIRKIS